ncbi:unnamed protein product, partial [Bubo scandiacus]
LTTFFWFCFCLQTISYKLEGLAKDYSFSFVCTVLAYVFVCMGCLNKVCSSLIPKRAALTHMGVHMHLVRFSLIEKCHLLFVQSTRGSQGSILA